MPEADNDRAPPQPPPRIGGSAITGQARVIYALMMRDMLSQHGNSRLNYLLRIILPIIAIGAIVLIFQLRGKVSPANFPLYVFLITGFPFWVMFRDTYTKVMRSADREGGLLMFPDITILDLVIAGFLLETAANTVVFAILASVVTFLLHEPPANLFVVLILYWTSGWLAAALGLCLSPLQRIVPMVVMFMNMFIRIGMWISGVMYTITMIPSSYWPLLTWNPLLHIIEGARQAWHPAYQSPIFDPLYIFSVAFVLTALGLVMERGSRRFAGT